MPQLAQLVTISDVKDVNVFNLIGVSDSPQDASIIAKQYFKHFSTGFIMTAQGSQWIGGGAQP